MRHTEIYFRKEWFGGYGWIFPKKSYAHVGIGVKTDANAFSSTVNKLLNEFIVELEQKGKIKKRPRSKTGGLIPVGGPVESVKGNVLLVGDAAGQTHPITGGGVPQAIICGKIAGKIAANAVQKKKDLLKEYDKKWRVIFEDELMRARRKRMYLELQWNHLDKIIKKCWPGFHEYYGN
jgi:flavin-dependent dehydrogenase